ncbi:MAG TPA: hypothetical protein VHL58_02560 [Thermoanaerobaculia bacterium]|nr:hypothetical protein [Thermoanaerobaculia bacterium]
MNFSDPTQTPPPSGGGVFPSRITLNLGGRDPRKACLLNAFLLCVGYFYIGQWQKGLVSLILATITFGLLIIPLCIFGAIDVYQQAQELQQGKALGQRTFFRNSKT